MLSKKLLSRSMIVSTMLFLSVGFAAEAPTAKNDADKVDPFVQAAMDAVRNKIETNLSGLPIDEIHPSPMEDWFEFTSRGDIYYVSSDGNYLFQGQLVQIIDGVVNLTSQSKRKYDAVRSPMRKKVLAEIADEELVVYQAKDEKHQVDVFVDINCGYCRKLHKEMDGFNALGITVRYLAYPRAGLNSSSARMLESAWCADDRPKAMADAILNRAVEPKSCKNPVADHYGLVKEFALTGTPNIIFANGDLWPGYIEPANLLKELEKRGL